MASMGWQRLQDSKLQHNLKIRAQILARIREFFIKEGFLEVETPILVPAAGQEPYLNPMKVHFQASHSEGAQRPKNPAHRSTGSFAGAQDDRHIDAYLITSPEYAHKKLLAAGFEKTFEITKAFRAGESWGGLHNPEFTMLEWYRARADYTAIMEDVERMVGYVIKTSKHGNIKTMEYQGKTIAFSSPWQRLTVREAFKQYAQVNLDEVKEEEEFFKIFLTHIEPKLGFPKPTILYEWPAQMAALARLKPLPQPTQNVGRGFIPRRGEAQGPALQRESDGERKVAERFELYIAGMELANAFSELTDASEQRRRFLQEQKLRKKLGKEMIPLDEDFLDAVGHLPPSAGIALGVDRLVMLLTDAKSIEEVLAFPAGELWDLTAGAPQV